MAANGLHIEEREQLLQQIDKLVKSPTFRHSDVLCRALHYLAEHSLEHPGMSVKEYQLATEVFGRPSSFDSQSDSTIRVQVGRLRMKLAEYYSSEGSHDPILVEVPKGSYALSFRHREEPSTTFSKGAEGQHQPEELGARNIGRQWLIGVMTLSLLLIAALTLNIVQFADRRKADAQQVTGNEQVPIGLRIFWKAFLSGPEEPQVVFSNATFVGRSNTGMRLFNPARDSGTVILDHYTGVGEVLAIHELDGLFGLFHRRIRVKRGALFTLDDAKNNNLIFVGSPAENLVLLDIPGTQQFVFQRVVSGPRLGDVAIINVNTRPGESGTFLPSPPTSPLEEDYSIIALVRGMNPAQSVMILAGTTTIGTQAAVEYVCREDTVSELQKRLGISDAGEMKPFEAVLRVKVAHGVPTAMELVATRTVSPSK